MAAGASSAVEGFGTPAALAGAATDFPPAVAAAGKAAEDPFEPVLEAAGEATDPLPPCFTAAVGGVVGLWVIVAAAAAPCVDADDVFAVVVLVTSVCERAPAAVDDDDAELGAVAIMPG